MPKGVFKSAYTKKRSQQCFRALSNNDKKLEKFKEERDREKFLNYLSEQERF
jgi:hypothetical protein